MAYTTPLRLITAAMILAFSVAGCESGDETTAPGEADSDGAAQIDTADIHEDDHTDSVAGHKIAWHEGDVESAFELAREENKPIFLYWGAEWCPPCHQIKATIFSKSEFIAKSKLFVPVYLDGDTEQAQKLGDRFGVRGYPTMIVFNSDGTEITRIPGGLDIGLYADVLDLTLSDIRPVAQLLDAVMAGEAVGDDDCRLLAYYSWSQDNERVMADRDAVETNKAMAESCSSGLQAESARLYVNYVMSSIAAESDEEAPVAMSAEQKAAAIERMQIILVSEELSRANLFLVLYYADTVVSGLTEPDSSERNELLSEWNSRLDATATNEDASIAHRLATTLTRISFVKMDDDDAEVPAALRSEASRQVAWADQQAKTPYQRQAVINTAWYVLSEAGLDQEATELLTAELEKSQQPYYFMLDLADLAEKAGRTDEALAWLQRAYEESEGPATRFQWGYNYVIGLLEMTPADQERIEGETLRVLDELNTPGNGIYNRTSRILERLDTRLTEWNVDGEYDDSLQQMRARVLTACVRIPEQDPSREVCEAFLVEA
jgi:thioredoxin-related protein